MNRKMIQLPANSMTELGIEVLKNNNTRHLTWRLFVGLSLFSLIGISACMVSLTNIDDFYAFINPSPYVAAIIILQGGIHLMFHHRKIIADMLHEMDQNIFTYPDENLLRVEYAWYMEERNIVLIMVVVKYASLLSLLMICLPVFYEILYYERIKTFIYPGWMPWKVDNLEAELCKFILQFLQAAYGVWLSYTMISFQIVTIIEFVRQYERLILAISSLEYRTFVVLLQPTKTQKDYDRIMKQNIINCIKHHQLLHKNFYTFKIWFSAFFSLELATSLITLAFSVFVMMNASNLGQVLNYFIIVFFVWINLLVRCFVSEIFSALDHNVSETLLYDVEWYKVNVANRRLLLMFHDISSRPLRLFGLSIFEATRITFAKLVRITYSIFNVLNLSIKH